LIYAFKYINGIPKEIWFDNMLTIVDASKMNQHDRINDNIDLIRCHPILNNPLNYNIKDVKDVLVSDLLKNSSKKKLKPLSQII